MIIVSNIMHKNIKKIIVAVGVVICNYTVAQDVVGLAKDASSDFYAVAERLYKNRSYYEATQYYELARKQKHHQRNNDLLYKLATSYRLSRFYTKAEAVYMELTSRAGADFPDAYYWLGKMQHANQKFSEAIHSYTTFINNYGYKLTDLKKRADLDLASARWAQENTKATPGYKVKPLIIQGIASPSYYGSYYNDGMLWLTSSVKVFKESKVKLKEVKGVYEYYYVDRLYYTKNTGKDEWTDGKTVENLFYSMSQNYLPPSFSSDGKKIYVSICAKTEQPFCTINEGDYSSGGSSISLDPMDAPINDEDEIFASKDPSVFTIGNTSFIIFSSNRDGGQGGFDLYVGEFNADGTVKGARNLGPGINTLGDEISPYYDVKAKTLFFSSDGHPGFGNYDVFMTPGDPIKGFGQVTNLGKPVNSGFDDYYFYQKSDGAYMGFVSSNRNDTNSCCDNVYKVDIVVGTLNITANIFDAATKLPLNNTTIKIFEDKYTKPEFILTTGISHTLKQGLVQKTPYRLVVSHQHWDSVEIALKARTKDTTINIYLKRNRYVLAGTVRDSVTKAPIVNAHIYFIDVLTNLPIDSAYTNSAGKYAMAVPMRNMYLAEIKAHDYMFFSRKVSFTAKEQKTVDTLWRNFFLKKIEIGGKVIFHNITFEFNSSILKSESYPQLNRVTQFLQENPTIRMEISGHTDNVGGQTYNQKLSENRAKSVLDYLVAKGIAQTRLEFKGYSFVLPIATNKTEEGRALNRRVEFKIIGK